MLPFWDSGESAAAAKAGTAPAAGGGIAAGASVVGLGAAKLGVTARCVAGAAGGYVVCDQIGFFSGPLPRERHHIATTANAARKAPTKSRGPSPNVTRTPAPTAADALVASSYPRERDNPLPRGGMAASFG